MFIGIVSIQFIYYVIIFGKFSFYKSLQIQTKRIAVSVIVCAKNEEENVKTLIPLLLKQDYFDYEIVLIDNSSSDNTLDIFEEFEKINNNIKIVRVVNNETFWGNKKYALTLGIKAAKNDYLIFTDADCYPTSKNWIKEMSSQFTLKKTIVLGYGGYEKISNSFLNKLIRFETLLTATQYFSWAKIGFPYMGVGRNLAYKKDEFFSINGFIEHMKIRSGDDDLFINQAANKSNITFNYNKESSTYSKPKTKYSEWFIQKRNHVSTAQHYKSFDRFQLSLFFISQVLFFVFAIILLALQFNWIIVLSLIVFRYLFTWISLSYSAKNLAEKDVMYWYPFLEIALLLTQINAFITNKFSKPAQWK